jgi:carbon-monoxide dehydrogenase medium subunit
VSIGAMVTYTELMDSAEARARPILGEVCAQIADVQVRNRGTIGGNVCSNDPTNHLPPLMVALGATMHIVGDGGERAVSAEEFFLGVYMTAAGPGELLTKITVPPGKSDGFASIPIGKDGTCIVNAAASVNGGTRVAIGCVDAVPVLLSADSAEADAVRNAVRGANLEPPSDVHASADYRRHLAEVVAVRAVAEAKGKS